MRRLVVLAAVATLASACGAHRIELKPSRILHGHVDPPPLQGVRDLHAFSARDAFLFLRGGSVLETRDGGRSWRGIVVRAPHGAPRFLTRTHWLASRGRRLYETVDGGRTWRHAGKLAPPLRAASFVSREVAHTCRAACFVSDDGGRSVTRIAVPHACALDREAALTAASGSFRDADHGLLVCGSVPGAGNQFKQAWSWDGTRWRPLPAPPTYGYVGPIEPLGGDTYVHHSGRQNDLMTEDGGRTWRSVLPPEAAAQGRWIAARTGWAFDPWRGDVFRTSDGGRRWRHVAPSFWPAGETVFCTPQVGFGAGRPSISGFTANATIFGTDDAGRHWSARSHLRSAALVRCDRGAVVATVSSPKGTRTLRSRDGARTWSEVRTPRRGQSFDAIAFVTRRIGFAVRRSGAPKHEATALLRTANGGGTWSRVPMHVPYFRPVTLVAAQGTIWILGPRCRPGRETCAPTLVRSDDGGRHWDEIRLDRILLSEPHFDSRTLGVAPGYRGFWITRDGGVTWRWRGVGLLYSYR